MSATIQLDAKQWVAWQPGQNSNGIPVGSRRMFIGVCMFREIDENNFEVVWNYGLITGLPHPGQQQASDTRLCVTRLF